LFVAIARTLAPRGLPRWAREPSDISVEDILRSIGSMEDDSLLNEVVLPGGSYETSASAMI
jgi:hypothetical protein